MSRKNPLTQPGNDSVTDRIVAQSLNHYATLGPRWWRHWKKYFRSKIQYKVGEIEKDSKGGNRTITIITYLRKKFIEKNKNLRPYIAGSKSLKFSLSLSRLRWFQIQNIIQFFRHIFNETGSNNVVHSTSFS